MEHRFSIQVLFLTNGNYGINTKAIEAGQANLNENSFKLYQVLEDLKQVLRLKAAAKGLDLIFERAADVPQYVQTDESKLRQVLINLLGNRQDDIELFYMGNCY